MGPQSIVKPFAPGRIIRTERHGLCSGISLWAFPIRQRDRRLSVWWFLIQIDIGEDRSNPTQLQRFGIRIRQTPFLNGCWIARSIKWVFA